MPEIGLAHVNPRFITDPVRYDSDDIQIWIHPDNPGGSLLLGTDKNADGALVVFNLRGEEIEGKTVRNLARPNNVDVLQGISTPGGAVDIAVVTERNRHQLRIFSLPDMKPLDRGGLPVFCKTRQNHRRWALLYGSAQRMVPFMLWSVQKPVPPMVIFDSTN
ncbi:MAG: phytase [Verrucomicrobia bacterium]|nr:phytase [Verrucomicrobiota bacterium]